MDGEAFQACLQEVHRISCKEPADPKNVYDSYYEARALLIKLRDEVLQMYVQSTEDLRKKLAQGQLARLYLLLGQNMAHCQETSEGKEMIEVAQGLLESARCQQFYDFHKAEERKKLLAKQAAEREECNQRLKEEATKKGMTVNEKRNAKWLPETGTDLDPVIDAFPIPTVFDNVCYDYVDMLMEVYNNLALQWSVWNEDLKAEKLLLNAQHIFDDWALKSPVKQLRCLMESPEAKEVTALSVQHIMDNFQQEAQVCAGLREEERSKQNDALQQKLLQKRMKKGLKAETGDIHECPVPVSPENAQVAVVTEQSEAELLRCLEKQRGLHQAKNQILEQRRQLEQVITTESQLLAQNMDAQYTITCYALGQIYSKLDRPHQAADCYLRVLNRQMEMDEFDRLQWIRNAANLALYYITEYDLPQAQHCLNAADYFHSQAETCPEDLTNTLHLTWGKYYQRMMKLDSEVAWQLEKDPNFKTAEDIPYAVTGPRSVCTKDRPHIPKAQFDRLPIHPPCKEILLPSNLAQFRSLFKKSWERYEKVLDYFNIDDFTEDRIYMMQEVSSIYEMLALHEEDLETKWTLHSKRIPFLEDFLDKLENVIFTNILRQYRFELGNVYQALADIRLEQLHAGRSDISKDDINKLLRKSQENFQQFVASFRTEWDMIENLKDAKDRAKEFTLEEDYLLPYILGNCSIAGITMKMMTDDKAQHEQNISQAVRYYQHCIDFAKKCKLEKKDDIQEHLKLCKEMVQLLQDTKGAKKCPPPVKPCPAIVKGPVKGRLSQRPQ